MSPGDRSWEHDCAALIKDEESAEAKLALKRAEASAAQRAFDAAHDARVRRDNQYHHAVAAIDAELKLLAPETIDAFVARMSAEWEQMRASGFALVGIHLGGEEAAARNADKSLRMEGLQAAIAEAEKLRLTALDGEPLLAALKDIETNMLDLARAARAARGQP